MGIGIGVIFLIIFLLMIASLWTIFTKAGRPGWEAIIPFYNIYVLTVIARIPWWWFVISLVPYIGYFAIVYIYYKVAQQFGKGIGYTVGLILLPLPFFPMLAFGSSEYMGVDEESASESTEASSSDAQAPVAETTETPASESQPTTDQPAA